MTKRSTKGALLTSGVALFVCFTMLIGTTFAWFTDSVTSANNIIKSGNLDVTFEYWNGTTWADVSGEANILTNDLWEPGVTEVAYLKVSNAGSLALKYQLGINIVSETMGKNVANEDLKLSDYLYFGVVEGAQNGAFANRAAAVAEVTNPQKISAGYTKEATMAAGEAAQYFALVVYMPETVGNEANHNGTVPQINLGLNVLATQLTAESDSFDNQYDKDAEFSVGVKDADGMNDNWDQNVLITDDFTVTSDNRASANYGLWAYGGLDGNGNTITDNSGAAYAGIYSESTSIKNLTLNTNSLFGIFASAKTEPLVVNNFTIDKSSNGAAFYAQNAPAGITLNDSTITASGVANNAGTANAVVFSTTNSKITINSGTYTATATNGYVVASFYSGSTVTINGGTFKGDLYPVDSGNIVINGGTFNGGFNVLNGNLVINGGTFSTDPSAYVTAGKTVTNNGNGTWTVS